MSEGKAASGGGIGFCGALFIAFVVLRLTDHIDWAWYWVASPLWMPLGLVVAIFAVAFPIAMLMDRRSISQRTKNGVTKL